MEELDGISADSGCMVVPMFWSSLGTLTSCRGTVWGGLSLQPGLCWHHPMDLHHPQTGEHPFLRVRILHFNELVTAVTTRHENTHCSYFCSMCLLLSISFACKSYGYFMAVHLGWKGFRWWFWTAVWIMDRGENKEDSFRIKYPACDGVLPSIWTDDWEYHLPRFSQSCTEAFMRWPLVCGK